MNTTTETSPAWYEALLNACNRPALATALAVFELLSSLVFEDFGSCGDPACFGGFDPVFERDACNDFGEVVKAA